jgi:Leucine-rich repeat (LRR) protein
MSRISCKANSYREFVFFLQEAASKKWDYLVISGRSDINYDVFEGINNFYQIEMDSSLAKQISEFPPEIGQLKHLRGLTIVGDFDTVTLPKEIGGLQNLEILDLESNYLQELPAEIGQLRNLKELNLRDNRLSSLPPEIGSLVSLEKLDLCFNTEMKKLPTEFGKLINLQELLISDNYFDESYLDEFLLSITNFTKLKLLEMVNIGITTIPPEIAKLDSLEDIDLHYNQLYMRVKIILGISIQKFHNLSN